MGGLAGWFKVCVGGGGLAGGFRVCLGGAVDYFLHPGKVLNHQENFLCALRVDYFLHLGKVLNHQENFLVL